MPFLCLFSPRYSSLECKAVRYRWSSRSWGFTTQLGYAHGEVRWLSKVQNLRTPELQNSRAPQSQSESSWISNPLTFNISITPPVPIPSSRKRIELPPPHKLVHPRFYCGYCGGRDSKDWLDPHVWREKIEIPTLNQGTVSSFGPWKRLENQ